MIGEVPIVMFDTSAHNRLTRDSDSTSVLSEMKSMWFRLSGLCVEELFACTTPTDRRNFFASCRDILNGPSEVFLPSNLLTEQLILAHFRNPATFNWKAVDVRWPECYSQMRNPNFYNDDVVSKEQRQLQWERKQSDKQRFLPLRAEIQAIFEAHDEEPPTTFRESVSRLEQAADSAIWYKAQSYYDLVTTVDSSEATVRDFAASCPPFLALIYATFVPWYNNAVRIHERGEKVIAGSNDLYMSVYLPYVDLFVTDDPDHQKALQEVAAAAKLETKIVSYDEFCALLPIAA